VIGGDTLYARAPVATAAAAGLLRQPSVATLFSIDLENPVPTDMTYSHVRALTRVILDGWTASVINCGEEVLSVPKLGDFVAGWLDRC
jgi:hypothetical protein